MTVYDVTLRTLSPLHIGDGDELRQDFDFATHNGRTYRFNEDAILNAKYDQLRPGRDGRYPTPGRLLNEADFQRLALFRYILRGIPRSAKTDARVTTCIKDIYDRPYVPGSSLKGALRTALAWMGWEEVKPRLNRSSIGRRRSWAGQPLEKELFGPNPNHDLLRALQVSDLRGPKKAGEGVVLVNAQVLTQRSAGSPVELEAIPGDITFKGTIKIDDSLFTEQAAKLKFGNRKHWLDELAARTQAHSQARIQELADWFENAESAERIAQFYRQLLNAGLRENQALMQIGWGAGWDGKTFWTHLQQDSRLFEQIIYDFRLQRRQRGAPSRREGDPFPRSKRAAMVTRQGEQKAVAPFGWVVLTLKERPDR